MSSLLDNPLVLSIVILAVANVIMLGLMVWMYLKLRRFLVPVDAQHIGDSLSKVSESLDDLQSFRSEVEDYLTGVERRLRTSARSIHTVRFNPFKGTGGGSNQSFSTAIVNEEGDGVIISSLYARDHVSIFGKPVSKFSSTFELSDEERESLEEARRKISAR